ncbi:fibrinogen-like protein A [Anopheles darlingi]|uniref:fibrinogen-like protein A n=1 Tax=Anopheles darlingi TaxID=43151 RepID=UPI0021003DB8|nr:fibrinogen-like protein A [Anopheles darlingi]
MKLAIGFIVLCVALYVGATNKCPETTYAVPETPSGDAIPGSVLARLDFIDRKLLELQVALKDHRAEVSRNFSVLQDRSKSRIPDFATAPASPRQPDTTKTISKTTQPTSCKEVSSHVSGVYEIRVNNSNSLLEVYCEQNKFGGGWIVVQYRFNGSIDFYRNWDEYRDGFGNVDSEFWLGLEKMHQITKSRTYELIVELKDFSGNYAYARYNAFEIGSQSEQYRLKRLGRHSGTAGDSMTLYNKGAEFSTKDRDINDPYSGAVYYEGAWWHTTSGSYSNLNGLYQNVSSHKSMFWFHFKNTDDGLSFSRMMIREQ